LLQAVGNEVLLSMCVFLINVGSMMKTVGKVRFAEDHEIMDKLLG